VGVSAEPRPPQAPIRPPIQLSARAAVHAVEEGICFGQQHLSSYLSLEPVPGSSRVSVNPLCGSSQNVPVNWGINTDRKRGFFGKVKEITGS
jgi:hypothetical protein